MLQFFKRQTGARETPRGRSTRLDPVSRSPVAGVRAHVEDAHTIIKWEAAVGGTTVG